MDKQNVCVYAQDFCVEDLNTSLDDAITFLTNLKEELTAKFGEQHFIIDLNQYDESGGDVVDESQIQYTRLETDDEFNERVKNTEEMKAIARKNRREVYLRLKEEFKDE